MATVVDNDSVRIENPTPLSQSLIEVVGDILEQMRETPGPADRYWEGQLICKLDDAGINIHTLRTEKRLERSEGE